MQNEWQREILNCLSHKREKENAISCKLLDRYDGKMLACIFISRLRMRALLFTSLLLNQFNKLVLYFCLN